MKKLAIIGSSNSFIKQGYGQTVKSILGDECDIYGLGISGFGWATYSLLKNDIVDKYEYILIEYGTLDPIQVALEQQSIYMPIAYILFILKSVEGSKSKIFFLNSAYINQGIDSEQYLILAIADIFSIPVINLQQVFRFISSDNMTVDGSHYSPLLVNYIAQEIVRIVNTGFEQKSKFVDMPVINFSFFLPTESDKVERDVRKTSQLQAQIFKCFPDSRIELPAEKFLCGIYYWLDGAPLNLYYTNDVIFLRNSLEHWTYRHLFCFHNIGATIYTGLQGGYLFPAREILPAVTEPCNQQSPVPGDFPLELACILLADKAPLPVGRGFYLEHFRTFRQHRYRSGALLHQRLLQHDSHFWKRISELTEAPDYVESILQQNPRLGELLDGSDLDAEKFILWLWYNESNAKTQPAINCQIIERALIRLYKSPFFPSSSTAYSILHHLLYLEHPELDVHDISTPEGREQVCVWFDNCQRPNFPV